MRGKRKRKVRGDIIQLNPMESRPEAEMPIPLHSPVHLLVT
jgi:hypothetical protein